MVSLAQASRGFGGSKRSEQLPQSRPAATVGLLFLRVTRLFGMKARGLGSSPFPRLTPAAQKNDFFGKFVIKMGVFPSLQRGPRPTYGNYQRKEPHDGLNVKRSCSQLFPGLVGTHDP